MIRTPNPELRSHLSEPEDCGRAGCPRKTSTGRLPYGRIHEDKKVFRANGKMISITDE